MLNHYSTQTNEHDSSFAHLHRTIHKKHSTMDKLHLIKSAEPN